MDEQLELGGRQADRLTGTPYLAGDQVDYDLARPQLCDRRVATGPQLRADPGSQLAERKRLDQVVDGTGVEPRDALLNLAQRGQHDHRRFRLGVADLGED